MHPLQERSRKINTFEKIYEAVKNIPKGKVATYGQIAVLSGNPRWSRVVGYALHNNPTPGVIPCHRVVDRFGRVASAFRFGGGDTQRRILESEGVEFLTDGSVNMQKFCINIQNSVFSIDNGEK